MSVCRGSVGLLVLLGAVLAFGNPTPPPFENHDTVADLLKLKESEIGGHPLFGSVIKSINTSCQRKEDIMLINATLDVYTRIFSSAQHHPLLGQLSKREGKLVTDALVKFQGVMEKLREKLVQLNHKRQDVMSELRKIKVDDPIDQRKALAEIREVYHVANAIANAA